MLKSLLRKHLFKIVSPMAGLLLGMGLFGLIFGFIAGVFVDGLTSGIRQRRLIKKFIDYPASATEASDLFISTAALMTGEHLCGSDSVKRSLLGPAATRYFPKAPPHCLDILFERKHASLETGALPAAIYFGKYSDEQQKNRLTELLRACGYISASGDEGLLTAAGLGNFEQEKCEYSREEDYAILGLSPGASQKEVRHIYHKLASQFHPDGSRHLSSSQQKITEDAFIRIKEAYERLVR